MNMRASKKRKRELDPIVKTTVSFPRSLKKQMNEYESKNYVNWSAVFAEAVRRLLNTKEK